MPNSQSPYQSPGPSESPLSPGHSRPSHPESFHDAPLPKIRPPNKATRRIRGEIACAECRRLKIRCDRTIPCSTCVKRGCGALCPNGTIPPGEGSRFVLAATEHLRNNLQKLESRMRCLEDALAIIHNAESTTPHPLLSPWRDTDDDETPMIKLPALGDSMQLDSCSSENTGIIVVDDIGGSHFFGPSGGSESFLIRSKPSLDMKTSGPTVEELDPSYLDPEISRCHDSFPFPVPNVLPSSVKSRIEAFLPTMDRVMVLCDTFLEHLSWTFQIISRHKLVNELIPIIYKENPVPYGPHDLALLLTVLAIGSLVDSNLPPYNLEAQHYHYLARATLALQPVLGAQSLVTVQVLHLMSVYNDMSGKDSNVEQSYMLLDLASQVALKIGLHIDPSMWSFEEREAYDRRVYFWNLMGGVLWQCLLNGRPSSMLMSYIDCRIPSADDERTFHDGEAPLGFGSWDIKMTAECLMPLVRSILAVKPPTYDTVLDLDHKIRDAFQPPSEHMENQTGVAATMLRFGRSLFQELMVLYLHRPYFIQAVTEYPDMPLGCPYSQSVLTTYSSACVVLKETRVLFMKQPFLCTRIPRIWSFSFTAAVIVGTIAIRGLHLNMRPSPMEELQSICKVFANAAETDTRAAKALPSLNSMLERSYRAMQAFQEGHPPVRRGEGDPEDLVFLTGQITMKAKVHVNNSPRTPVSSATDPPLTPLDMHSETQVHQPNLVAPQPMTPSTSSMMQSNYGYSQAATSSSTLVNAPIRSTSKPEVQPQTQAQAIRPMPLIIPITKAQEYQTFADLTEEWNGVFQQVPAYPYGFPRHHADSAAVSSPGQQIQLQHQIPTQAQHPPHQQHFTAAVYTQNTADTHPIASTSRLERHPSSEGGNGHMLEGQWVSPLLMQQQQYTPLRDSESYPLPQPRQTQPEQLPHNNPY
ncbi:hypothetical protein CVT24_008700 [Panaeolus cyanescens]|uniref:Zn(2)-C6 fungal-type domain-containing protein n=1 Tax=Panaeolus cyanescens TaxID=181874 RepID=A0A409VKJ4_9AGAR|nr:hypothetical protein CVT24_008700 [Panaeolus cyanescens]